MERYRRQEIAIAIAKVLAYLGCGKPEEARRWFGELLDLLNKEGLGWS